MITLKQVIFNGSFTLGGVDYIAGESYKTSEIVPTKQMVGTLLNSVFDELGFAFVLSDESTILGVKANISTIETALLSTYEAYNTEHVSKNSPVEQTVNNLALLDSLKLLGVELADILPVRNKVFGGKDKEVAVLVHAGQSNGEGYPVIANVSGLQNVFCATRSGNRNGNMANGNQDDIVWGNYDSADSSLGGYKTDTNNLAHQVCIQWQAHIDAGNSLNLPDLYLVHICWGDSGFGVGYDDDIRNRWSFEKAGDSIEHLAYLQRNVLKCAVKDLLVTKKTIRVLGYVWVHGGYDAKLDSDTYTYESQLRRLVDEVDMAFGTKVPFYPIRHNSNNTTYAPNRDNINKAFEAILTDTGRSGYMLEPSTFSGFVDERHLSNTNQGTTFTDTVHYSGPFFDELGTELFNDVTTKSKSSKASYERYLSVEGGELIGKLELLRNLFQSVDNPFSNLIARNSYSNPALYVRNKNSAGPIQKWEAGDGDIGDSSLLRAELNANGDFYTVGKLKGEDRFNLYKGTGDASAPDKRIGFKYESSNDMPSLLAYDETLAEAIGMYIAGWSESTYAMKAGADRSVDFGGSVSFSGVSLDAKVNQIVGAVSKSERVADITSRDALTIATIPTFVFVDDDGDGNWALYLAKKLGDASTFISSDWEKVSDPDFFNAVMNKAQIESTLGGSLSNYFPKTGGTLNGHIEQTTANLIANFFARDGANAAMYVRNKQLDGIIQKWESGTGVVNDPLLERAKLLGNGDFITQGKIQSHKRIQLYKESDPTKRITLKYDEANDIPSFYTYDETLAQRIAMYLGGWDETNYNMKLNPIDRSVDFGGDISIQGTSILSLVGGGSKKSIQATFGSKYAYTNNTDLFFELNDTGGTFFKPPYSLTGWKVTGWTISYGTGSVTNPDMWMVASNSTETQVGGTLGANTTSQSNSLPENVLCPSGGFSVRLKNTDSVTSPVVILYMEEV